MSSNSLSERLRSIKETISEFRFECVEFEHQLKSVFGDLDGIRLKFESSRRQVNRSPGNNGSMLDIASTSDDRVNA